MCCGAFIAKYVLFIANLVFALAGVAVISLGILVLVQLREIQEIIPINIVPISLIVLGAVVFVIAFLACCGAIRESRCMLIMYSVCMVMIAGFKIYLSIEIFSFLGTVEETVTGWLTRAFNGDYTRRVFHALELLFQCCGTVGPSSYEGQPLPPSCCANPIDNTCSQDVAHGGCNALVTDYFETFGEAIGAVLIVVIAIEVVLVVLACFFSHNIANKRKQYA